MSHIWTSHVSHLDESCLTSERIMSHMCTPLSHNKSCVISERVMFTQLPLGATLSLTFRVLERSSQTEVCILFSHIDMYLHTHALTHTRTHTCTHTHTHTRAEIDTYMHIFIFTLVYMNMYSYACKCVCVCVYTYIYIYMYTYKYVYVSTHTYIRKHTYTHTYIHTFKLCVWLFSSQIFFFLGTPTRRRCGTRLLIRLRKRLFWVWGHPWFTFTRREWIWQWARGGW